MILGERLPFPMKVKYYLLAQFWNCIRNGFYISEFSLRSNIGLMKSLPEGYMHTHFRVEDFKSSNIWLYWAAEK